MKKKVLLTLGLLGLLMLGGCKEDNNKLGTLSAPQQITVQSNGGKSLIIFDEVANAEYYNVYINDMSITVKSSGSGTIEFDATKIISLPQSYTIKVKAGSSNYFDSQFSNECHYSHKGMLEAPVLTIDGTTLNWNKIENAGLYDISVTTFNPTIENIYTYPINTYDFSNLLTTKGEYAFKVRAVSEADEYLASNYSNTIKYTNNQTLITPYNLATYFDAASNELMLNFLSSKNVMNFSINVDGVNYNIAKMSAYFVENDFKNAYSLKLTSFLSSKGISISSSNKLNVSIKALSTEQYLLSSGFSNPISCSAHNILPQPQLVVNGTDNVEINVRYNNDPYNYAYNSQYLSGYAIYLDEAKHLTIPADMTNIVLPGSVIGNKGIRVQAISNNSNCYSSSLSNVKYLDSGLTTLPSLNINYNNGDISWNKIEGAKYYLEISNNNFKKDVYFPSDAITSFDVTDICEPSNYNVRLIAFKEGFKQSEATKSINYSVKLGTVDNVEIREIGDIKYLYFNRVENADGYVLYVRNISHTNSVLEDEIFESSPININKYMSDAASYGIKVKAISYADSHIQSGNPSEEVLLQNIKTLSMPSLSISEEDGKYYLNINVNEMETSLARGCEIWIDYVSIGVREFKDGKIEISSHLANAGEHNFRAKAISNGNSHIKDSNIVSINKTIKKQLDIVQNIIVKEIKEESRYILEFDEQTLAAKYQVKIVKAEDMAYSAEFEITSGYADITQYVKADGVYKVYVTAVAKDSGVYEDSATSGNPFRFKKGLTLASVQNVSVAKAGASVKASWDAVQYASRYQVKVEYTSPSGLKSIKNTTYTTVPELELADGTVDKEGVYVLHIKSIGDDDNYENSQNAVYSYTHIMETVEDFERNKTNMYGNTYNYHVTTIDDLKHLLWRHYLYNDEVWSYDSSLNYNLKIYCELDAEAINEMAYNYSQSLEEEIKAINDLSQKLQHIATRLLAEYPEMAGYILGEDKGGDDDRQDFCEKPDNESAIYLFRYQDALAANKLETIKTTITLFDNKVSAVDAFDERSTNYIFPIDKRDSMDVTTSEQLFAAVQYGYKPNFVGDSQVAEIIYENAKFLLRKICSDKMTDYDKALAIYNLLSSRVAYNPIETGDANELISNVKRGDIKDFYLEGILYNTAEDSNGLFADLNSFTGLTATDDGFAKAYVVLCAIEGIDCVKVNGTEKVDKTFYYHAWNKIYLATNDSGIKQWYVVDIASSRTNIAIAEVDNQVASHNYFMVEDNYLDRQIDMLHMRLGEGDYSAETKFDYYANKYMSYTFNYTNNSNTSITDRFKGSHKIVYDINNGAANQIFPLIVGARLSSKDYNGKHKVVLELDVSDLIIGMTTIESIIKDISESYSGLAQAYLAGRGAGGNYQGNFTMTYIDNVVIMCFVPN